MDRVAHRGPLARAPGALKGGTLPKLSTFLSQLKGGPFGEKTNFRKVSQCRKTGRGDPLGFFNIHSVAKHETQRRSGASQHMTKTTIILICVYILF